MNGIHFMEIIKELKLRRIQLNYWKFQLETLRQLICAYFCSFQQSSSLQLTKKTPFKLLLKLNWIEKHNPKALATYSFSFDMKLRWKLVWRCEFVESIKRQQFERKLFYVRAEVEKLFECMLCWGIRAWRLCFMSCLGNLFHRFESFSLNVDGKLFLWIQNSVSLGWAIKIFSIQIHTREVKRLYLWNHSPLDETWTRCDF